VTNKSLFFLFSFIVRNEEKLFITLTTGRQHEARPEIGNLAVKFVSGKAENPQTKKLSVVKKLDIAFIQLRHLSQIIVPEKCLIHIFGSRRHSSVVTIAARLK
jgi:hypothetical protein